MQRCLELAVNGLGKVAPNPMVGCVIVHNDRIIGEGYHAAYGAPHAEVNAIKAVKDKELLKNAKLYVNLEPCAHFGKTPPCSDMIIQHQIPEVIIGCMDSYSEVAGKGIEKLRKSGCQVTVNVLEKESRELNRRFFTFYEKKRPYVILKWAQTLDGFIDIDRSNPDIKPEWITNKFLKILVHKWRTEEVAILVGTRTAKNDNPQLTAREWHGSNPVRIVIDEKSTLPSHLHLFDQSTRTIIFTSQIKANKPNLEYISIDFNQNIIPQILDQLYELGLQSIIVEGGKMILESFIQAGFWDEARVLIGNKVFQKGIKSPEFEYRPVSGFQSDKDKVLFFKNS
jgi:diaminohydroxyphosphoribosylaminopyrimidine deaminase/5-amino-6-(5-phosphoribosylamino)uracil reductase